MVSNRDTTMHLPYWNVMWNQEIDLIRPIETKSDFIAIMFEEHVTSSAC